MYAYKENFEEHSLGSFVLLQFSTDVVQEDTIKIEPTTSKPGKYNM